MGCGDFTGSVRERPASPLPQAWAGGSRGQHTCPPFPSLQAPWIWCGPWYLGQCLTYSMCSIKEKDFLKNHHCRKSKIY